MTSVVKHIKPYLAWLLLAVALLFLQAVCDLRLPDYMSKIVSVGVQQNGIEQAAPEAISQQGMQFMQTFMTGEEREMVAQHYALVTPDQQNQDGKTYGSLYPQAGQNLYVKVANLTPEVEEQLDETFGKAALTFVNALQAAQQQGLFPAGFTQNSGGQEFNFNDIDFRQVYPLGLMFQQPQMASLLQQQQAKAATADPLMSKQVGVMFTHGFYRELGADVGAIQRRYVLRVGGWMLLISLAGGAATILVTLLSARASAGFAKDVRQSIFEKVQGFSNAEFDKFSTASLITRTTNDVTQIQMFLMMGVRMLCYAPIMMVGGIIMAVNRSPSMSWIIALAGVVLMGLMGVVFAISLPKFKLMQRLVDKLNLIVREHLNGLPVIRAFSTRDYEKGRFEAANQDVTRMNLFINRVMAFMMPAMMLIFNSVSLLVVWVGAHQIADANMQIGDMMAFMQYAMQVIISFFFVSMMFVIAPRAVVSAGRIAEVLNTVPTIQDPPQPKAAPAKQGVVEFRNVSFRYQGAEDYALRDISFTARPGQTTAIIGSTGSGKSTIAHLLLRFYDATEGAVLIDGVDVREMSQQELRDQIGYVPQRGVLLSGTIASNIRYGRREASDEEVAQAARIAQAEEFILEKKEQYDYPIAQGGTNVSGGQKQRLSIARALAKKPKIFVFDDSFSALDYKTDAALRKALKEQTEQHTTIVIAQRVSTIRHADQILVLDQGRLVGKGTHEELLKTCPTYWEIASSQLAKEELA